MIRPAKLYDAFGESKTIPQWERDPRCVVDQNVLRNRIWRGTPIEEALSRPARPHTAPISPAVLEKDREILALAEGRTSDELAQLLGITRENARQRLHRAKERNPGSTVTLYGVHRLTAFGETKSLSAWLRDPRCKVSYPILSRRHAAGMDSEKAMTEPAGRPKRKAATFEGEQREDWGAFVTPTEREWIKGLLEERRKVTRDE